MVLQVYTNENNPGALKLLIALKYAGQEAKINFVDCTDKSLPPPKHLPYVQLQEERIMFSTNAVLQYFFPPSKDDEALAYRWLEFEAYELAPVLSVALGSSARSPKIKTMLLNSLGVLNENLKDTPFNKKAVSAPDIAIWSVLYPLYSDEGLCKEYLDSYPNLCQWMKHIGEEKNIMESIKDLNLSSGTISYQALLAGTKYPAGILTTGLDNQTSSTPVVSEVVTVEELEAAKIAWSKTYKDLPEPRKEVYPVLPVPGEKNVLITSALPYVNNVPHLGNIIGCVLSSDVFARFSRLCNWNTLLIGGTDEYGTATETKALEEGLTPQQICDKYFDIHNSIYRWFNIGFDYFGRTTTPEQTNLVQGMFLTLNENGFMATQPVDQLLCEKCNRYLADRFVEGGCPQPGCNYEDARGDQCDGCGKLVNATELKNPRCKVCRSTPVLRTSHQFFLDLPKLEPLLLHWMEKSVHGWTNNAKVITKSWMREGLKPRCITRDLKWGVPVPLDGYRDKVFYVWFDAPLGYVSMTEKYTKEWRKWWQPEKNTDVSLYQFMAKDNVPFHSVMFPACLLGANAGWTLVSHIMATEYLNYEDGKFSKSRGVGVFGTDAQSTTIPSDVWRFYLLYVRPEGQDSSFSWVDLATKNNSELLNNLGNFVNRALMFSEKYFNSQIPEMNPNDEDYKVLALCTRELKTYITSLEKGKLRDGIRCLLAISKHGNQYMQSTQPWVLVKATDEDKERAGTVIGICCTLASLLSTLMIPYMPETSRILRKQLNAPERTTILTADTPQIVNLLPPGHKIGKPAPLFSKIDAAYIEEMKKKFGGTQQASETVKANSNIDVASLEKDVQIQADKVRTLKSSGVEKSVWQPEVAVLLDLKKKLEAAQKNQKNESKVELHGNLDVASLEKAVQSQADKVRSLKTSGAEKSVWQPEVAVLLDLKKKLEIVQKNPKVESKAEPPSNGVATEEELKKVEMEIEKQGVAVRTLKESGAPKSEWEPQVKVLLQLKEKYATLSGKPLPAPSKSKKNKK